MKKANLHTWNTTREKTNYKSKTALGVFSLKDDRALCGRFFVVVLSIPEIDLKERALLNYDGDLRHCLGKSKLMSILQSSLPDQRPDQEEDQRQHAGRSVLIIDGMAFV